MQLIQNSDISCRELFTIARKEGEQSFLFIKKLMQQEKLPDADVSSENWVEPYVEVDIQNKRLTLASRIEVCVS